MTDTNTGKAPRAKVANHYLIGIDGAKVDNEEDAAGIGYELIGVALPFEVDITKMSGSAQLMLAIFGAKTLATNESSQARNDPKGAAELDEQMAAVRERFALLETGTWVDRSREGVGAKIDKDQLAAAIVAVATAAGKQADLVKVRDKLESDAAWLRQVRQVPAIASEYATLMGRKAPSLDDVMGAV